MHHDDAIIQIIDILLAGVAVLLLWSLGAFPKRIRFAAVLLLALKRALRWFGGFGFLHFAFSGTLPQFIIILINYNNLTIFTI